MNDSDLVCLFLITNIVVLLCTIFITFKMFQLKQNIDEVGFMVATLLDHFEIGHPMLDEWEDCDCEDCILENSKNASKEGGSKPTFDENRKFENWDAGPVTGEEE